MKVGDKVEKRTGYKWPGEVVAVFPTKAGQTRCVVECTHPVVAGALHIYAPEQLVLRVDVDEEIETDLSFLDSDPRLLDFGPGYTTRLRNMFDTYKRWNEYTPLKTVRDVIALTERDLLLQNNIGKKCVHVLRTVLAQHGLRLGS